MQPNRTPRVHPLSRQATRAGRDISHLDLPQPDVVTYGVWQRRLRGSLSSKAMAIYSRMRRDPVFLDACLAKLRAAPLGGPQ